MKQQLYIFGDSFSSDNSSPFAWTMMLGNHYDVINFSARGISEYRIWKKYQSVKQDIDGMVLFCHTSPSRIYLKDTYASTSRSLNTHPECDIILEDIYSKKEKELINAVETIWDEGFLQDTYDLFAKSMLEVPNSFHITFFENDKFVSYNNIWKLHKGTINHLSVQGNAVVLENVLNLIRGV